MRATLIGVVALSAMLGACADDNVGPNLRTGEAAYETIPAPVGAPRVQDYRIGALDTLDIVVFQEADISTRGVVVDAAGVISMPLIGRIQAAGNTSTQLADLLAAKLAERFYVNPQVTVTVASSVAQRARQGRERGRVVARGDRDPLHRRQADGRGVRSEAHPPR
jgi:polysaccharide export outer membrane protein